MPPQNSLPSIWYAEHKELKWEGWQCLLLLLDFIPDTHHNPVHFYIDFLFPLIFDDCQQIALSEGWANTIWFFIWTLEIWIINKDANFGMIQMDFGNFKYFGNNFVVKLCVCGKVTNAFLNAVIWSWFLEILLYLFDIIILFYLVFKVLFKAFFFHFFEKSTHS